MKGYSNVMEEVLQNLNRVQFHCTKIMEEIDKVCRENNIKYSLTGGSVIGAHLYKGIIPWDDDIDIMMTRDNYDKFLSICDEKLPPRYKVKNFENGRDKTTLFSKVSDEETTIVELKSGGKKVISGIFVDVTVMDKIPQNGYRRKVCYMFAKILQCCRERNYERIEGVRNLVRNIGVFVLKPFANRIYRIAKSYFMSTQAVAYDYAELLAGFTISFDKNLFEKYVDIEFEGKKFMIVEDYMSYLEKRYGKREFYVEQRQGDLPHHLIYVDCERSYREYNECN